MATLSLGDWREWRAVAVIGAVGLAIFGVLWSISPTADPGATMEHGIVRGFGVVETRLPMPPRVELEVTLLGGGMIRLRKDQRLVQGCTLGAPIRLTRMKTNAGLVGWDLPLKLCD